MKRTKLADRVLPTYTKGEEIFNMTSHIVGAAFGLIALIVCLVVSIIHKDMFELMSSLIYGVNMIVLYTMSSIYHGLSPKLRAKKVFQILDHCSIYLLIAGSYTPFCLVTFMRYNTYLGWSMFLIIWLVAIIGVVFDSIDLKRFRVISKFIYLILGWCIIFKISLLIELIGLTGFILLLSGGIAYTFGAILFAIGMKKKYIHSVFHLFILLGTFLQFICIIKFVL